MFIASRHCADRYTTACNMHSRTPVGLLSPGIIKDNSDAGEITRMSKKRVQTGNFSDYVPLLIEGFSYSWLSSRSSWGARTGIIRCHCDVSTGYWFTIFSNLSLCGVKQNRRGHDARKSVR